MKNALDLLKKMAQAQDDKMEDIFADTELSDFARRMEVCENAQRIPWVFAGGKSAKWRDISGGELTLHAYGLDLGNGRILLWTCCDGSGIDDIVVRGNNSVANSDDNSAQIQAYAEEIAEFL